MLITKSLTWMIKCSRGWQYIFKGSINFYQHLSYKLFIMLYWMFHCHPFFSKLSLTVSFVCLSMIFIFLIRIVLFPFKFAVIGNCKRQLDQAPFCDLNSVYQWRTFSLLTNTNVNKMILFVCLFFFIWCYLIKLLL